MKARPAVGADAFGIFRVAGAALDAERAFPPVHDGAGLAAVFFASCGACAAAETANTTARTRATKMALRGFDRGILR